jgi:hypothetical protein
LSEFILSIQIVAPQAVIFSWVGANTGGHTKRIASNAAIAVGFSLASIIGPQTFQAKDVPNYLPAKIIIFRVAGGDIVTSVLLRLLYEKRYRKSSKLREYQVAEGVLVAGDEDYQTDRTYLGFV